MLDNTPNQPSLSIFQKKNWIEINDGVGGTCNTNSQMEFKTAVLKCEIVVTFTYLLKERKLSSE